MFKLSACTIHGSRQFGKNFPIIDQHVPATTVHVEGLKKLQEHYYMEYIMSFLMGLKDTYSQVRGNILLMDPLVELSIVFHLVTQEENQRGLSTAAYPTPPMAFSLQGDKSSSQRLDSTSSKTYPPRKNRPFCTHCTVLGHTIEKCYKLHGYPPGYNKPKQPKEAAANQFQTNVDTPKQENDNNTLLPQLTNTQYQQLLNLLANQQSGMPTSDPSSSTEQCQQEDDWQR
ncbi:uncharacterized protein LOC133805305 [Humulus lupulus]|uniref:uncharacterized protein LOC133805305 n=1 Tax=Humulus lupulus TaxID=3486 RepID=UPI002B402AAC|nr:uncharacterized protein LOC133805305 [Humulus lupulus]